MGLDFYVAAQLAEVDGAGSGSFTQPGSGSSSGPQHVIVSDSDVVSELVRPALPHCAEILTSRTRAGRPISAIDAQIAATARQHQATLANRNTADFTDTGLDLINPWEAA